MKIAKEAAVHLHLLKQGLYHPPERQEPSDVLAVLNQLGCVQLDTLNVVTRTHNLVFLARMAEYSEAWFWKLYEEKQAFEGHAHALSIMPPREYPYWLSVFQVFRERMMEELGTDKTDFLLDVYKRVGEMRAPFSSKDLNGKLEGDHLFADREVRPGDWSTTPTRWSLDKLWRSGMLIQVRDSKFNKLYHLAEDWLPADWEREAASLDEVDRHCTLRALDAMGVATIADLADYFRLEKRFIGEAVQALIDAGEVREVEVAGDEDTYYVRVADMDLLTSSEILETPEHSAFLSPFDNLIWHRPRLLKLYDVDYRLECYIPQAQRKYGYYALLILIRGKIVGTIDLKMERKSRTLIIQRWVLFDGFKRSAVVGEIALLLARLMRFLQAEKLDGADAEVFLPFLSF